MEYPLTKPEIFKRVGVEPPKGILLYGSPGTGKTLIAKAVAHEAKATFIRMSGSELVHKFIGGGAGLVRELFVLARERAPAIVFIDEIDAVGSIRTNDEHLRKCRSPADTHPLLAEMDGFDNRGDLPDNGGNQPRGHARSGTAAPGKFNRLIQIPLPDQKARLEILKIHSRSMNLNNVSLESIAAKTENATGAGLQAVCREAGMRAVRRDATAIEMSDFLEAISKVKAETVADTRMYT